MKRGFTLVEVLVASLLMGMLITILTMVFNSSAIAWRTGKAGVAKLNDARYKLSIAQKLADETLPVYLNGTLDLGMNVSAFDFLQGGSSPQNTLRTRAFAASGVGVQNNDNVRLSYINSQFSALGNVGGDVYPWQAINNAASLTGGDSVHSYIVGVKSYGPDRQPNTSDDITTWPEDAQ